MNYLCITEYFHLCILQPERIDPSASRQGYDVRSDVWSLGITLVRPKGFIKLSCCDKDKSTVLDSHGSLSVISMSWQQEDSPTLSGIVFSIS